MNKLLGLIASILFILPHFTFAEDLSRDALTNFASQVSEAKLSNGLRVIMYRRGTAPVFAGVVGVRVGGSDEKPGITGISHMLEHMAFKGTPKIGTLDFARESKLLARLEELVTQADGTQNFSAEQNKEWEEINTELTQKIWTTETFTREYEKQGASGMNATTDSELTKYFVNLPRTGFEFWCYMESERLANPVFRQFYQERDVVMEERRMRNDNSPQGKLYERLIDAAFIKHPYRLPVIGYAKDIQRLTTTQVYDFRNTYYVPSNIVIALVGDVSAERDLPMIERYFGRIPVGKEPPRPLEVEPQQTGQREIEVKFPASPITYLAYHKPVYPHPDDPAISLAAEMLGGSSTSPLYAELVKKRQIITGTDFDEAPGNAYPNLLIFSLTPRDPHTNKEALAGYDQIVSRYQKTGFTEDQLKIAKRAISVQYLGRLKSNLSLANDLASIALTHGNWRELVDWYDDLMKVTNQDISRVLNQYLVPSNRTVARVERGAKEE